MRCAEWMRCRSPCSRRSSSRTSSRQITLRPIRLLVNDALKRLNGLFSVIYADTVRAVIASEKLMRALLLQVSTRCAASAC